jgi:hypothetical protein
MAREQIKGINRDTGRSERITEAGWAGYRLIGNRRWRRRRSRHKHGSGGRIVKLKRQAEQKEERVSGDGRASGRRLVEQHQGTPKRSERRHRDYD